MASKIYHDINLGVLRLGIRNKKILDLGCGTGTLGAKLQESGNTVFGVDIAEEDIALARSNLDQTLIADITKLTTDDLPNDFDIIILADILEHLPDPDSLLQKAKLFLKPSGIIVISLPNIACFTIRLALLFGQFNYTDYGIMDKTHLRFFTKKTARALLINNGFAITRTDYTPYFTRLAFRIFRKLSGKEKTDGALEGKILESRVFTLYRKWIFPIEHFVTKLWPSLFAYQFIIVARP